MYYVGKNGNQSGPYPLDELKNMAASGKLAPNDLVWTDGMSEWKPSSAALPELFPTNPPAPAPMPAPAVEPFPSLTPSPSPVVPVPAPAPAPTSVAAAPTPHFGLPRPPVVEQPVLTSGAPIPTYLWQSIVVTLFCCIVTGIPAIVFSSQVESKRQRGDIAGAMKASQNARLWCWISLPVAFVLYIVVGLLVTAFFRALSHIH